MRRGCHHLATDSPVVSDIRTLALLGNGVAWGRYQDKPAGFKRANQLIIQPQGSATHQLGLPVSMIVMVAADLSVP
jgi:hypothetical protein